MYILRSKSENNYLYMIKQDKNCVTRCFINDITLAIPYSREEAEELAQKYKCDVVEYNGPFRKYHEEAIEQKKAKKIKPITIKRRGNKRVHPPKI